MSDQGSLGRYRLVRRLASGGMGEVFLARHEGPAGFAKTLVIKRILPHLARDPRFVELFLDEARLAAHLSHPNVVQIFELGEAEGVYFIAMEYIDGRSVRAVRQRLSARGERVPIEIAARICSLALQGLHYAHELKDEQGRRLHLVHRDVSPDNLLISFAGAVKVVDFGIARAVDAADARFTRTVRGKFHYMAPEQLAGHPGSARTDVYAVGVLLYELLAGERLFSASSPEELAQLLERDAASKVLDLIPGVPASFNDVVARAVAPDPARRFSTAEEMAVALERELAALPSAAGPLELAAFMRGLFPDSEEGGESKPLAAPDGTRSFATASEFATDPEPSAATAPDRTAQPGTITAPAPQESTVIASARSARGLKTGTLASIIAFVIVAGVWSGWRAAATPPAPASANLLRTTPTLETPAEPSSEERPSHEQSRTDTVHPQHGTGLGLDLTGERAGSPGVEAEPERVAEQRPARPAKATGKRRSARVASLQSPRGEVTIRVYPWAEVTWGTRKLGTTPLKPFGVPAGTHVFVLRNSDLKVVRRIRVVVPPGGRAIIEGNLMRDHVEAQSLPAAAASR